MKTSSRFALLLGGLIAIFSSLGNPVSGASTTLDPGVGNVPQGTQSDAMYASSYGANGVTNRFVTSRQVSCYRPEVPVTANNGPNDGYTGESPCPGANTGEDTGASAPYPTQAGSRAPFPASQPMLVKDHSESDIRVDPTNPNHVIGSTKWFAGPEGYNHLLGFYESWDGGKTWRRATFPVTKASPTTRTRWAPSTPTATITRPCCRTSSITRAAAPRSTSRATNPTPRSPTRLCRLPCDRTERSARPAGSRPTTAGPTTSSPPMPGWARNRTRNG